MYPFLVISVFERWFILKGKNKSNKKNHTNERLIRCAAQMYKVDLLRNQKNEIYFNRDQMKNNIIMNEKQNNQNR